MKKIERPPGPMSNVSGHRANVIDSMFAANSTTTAKSPPAFEDDHPGGHFNIVK